MAAMIASDPEVNHLDMDEFINFSVTNESPARPIIMRMNQAAAAAAAAAAAGSINAKDLPSSPPFDAEFALQDLGAHASNEWLNNMGLDSVLSVCSPSSRGSSLETPNLPQNGFVSIDPTRLKEAASAAASEMSKSPSWSLPDLQPSSYEAPSVMSAASQTNEAAPRFVQNAEQSLEIEQFSHSQVSQVSRAPSEPAIAENPVEAPAHPSTTIQQPSSRVASLTRRLDNAVIGKRKRQGSLPDIFIQVPQQQQPQPRGLQRSMSTGTPVIITQFDNSPASLETFFEMPSPVQGPQSAPPIGQHPMSFAFQSAPAQTSAAPLLRPQQNGHQRASSHSGLATIPEASCSAPADVQWTPIPPPQVRYGNTDITTYSVPAPPATPSLPCPSPMAPGSMLPSPLLEPEALNGPPSAVPSLPGVSVAPAAAGAALRRPNSCPSGTPSANGFPGRIGYTFQLQQQEAQRQYLQPHCQQLQVQQQQQFLVSPQLGPHMSAQAHFSPLPTYSPQLSEDQFPMQNGPLSAGGMPHGGSFSAGPIPNNGPIVSNVGIGRPVMGTQSAHARRSSDSELAFAMGYPSNISAMLRSTSGPQAILAPTPMYASGIPPPPPIGNHPTGLMAYEQNAHVHSQLGLGFGHPHREPSPPRKRVASKRVGTCLKPGPKGKPKPKPEGEMTIQLSTQPFTGFGEDPLHSIHDEIPANLTPVSFEEFQASFDITPAGTIIPMLGIEAMTERLMYATPEAVVDACFRWCYQIDSEYNMAAEKQSKFFRCCFDECVGSNSRIFMRKSAVDSHVRTHIGFRPFRCEVDPDCDARFVRKHDRDRHVATTHRNEKSFLCTDCGQNFARSDALLRHRAKRDACKARTGQL